MMLRGPNRIVIRRGCVRLCGLRPNLEHAGITYKYIVKYLSMHAVHTTSCGSV